MVQYDHGSERILLFVYSFSVFQLVYLSVIHEYYPKLQHNKLGKGI